MRYALKEWGATVETLGQGQIIAIWRKGGLEDTPSVLTPSTEFNIEQKQFVLFPTNTHQNLNKIKREYWHLIDEKSKPNKDNQIRVGYWAEIEGTLEINSLEQLLSISHQLVNTDEHLISSWNLYPDHKGKLLFLRVHKLNNPILIPNSPDYAGCKSWIELKIDIPKIGSKPVLSYKDFNIKARFVKALLEDAFESTSKVAV